MFLSEKSFYVGYIEASGFTLYTKHGETYYSFDFPKALVSDLEVKDKAALQHQLGAWLANVSTKPGSLVLVLAPSVLFEKSLPQSDTATQNAQVQAFVDTIPIAPEKIGKVVVKTQSGNIVYITNAELYQSLVTIRELQKWRILAVLPGSVFGAIGSTGKLAQTEVDLVKRTLGKVYQADFLTSGVLVSIAPPKPEILAVTPQKTRHRGTFVLLAIFLFMLAILSGLVFKGKLHIPGISLTPKKVVLPDTTSASQSGTPIKAASSGALLTSPTPVATDAAIKSKDRLTVQVLNGSGIVGQATTVRDALIKAGFTTIETGNTKVASGSSTTAAFAPTVAATNKLEVMQVLQTLFASVKETTLPKDAPKDIIITTAK